MTGDKEISIQQPLRKIRWI